MYEPFTHVGLSDSKALAGPAASNQVLSQAHFGQSHPIGLPAPPAHGKVDCLHNICADCPFVSSNKSELEKHALDAGHASFPCVCGAQFARAFCLTRHINSKIGPSFPCGLCDDKSFPRLDKLGDHLRRWHRLGDKAFNQYKGGDSCTGSGSQPADENRPMLAEEPRQAYPVAPGFDAISLFDELAAAVDIALDASSVQSTASPGNSTAADNWWYSQPGNNSAYPS